MSRAGGGGGTAVYWELADRLGTGLVLVDETGARLQARAYTPFGEMHAQAGSGSWMPGHYAGHLADPDSGLVHMQARWYEAESGTFLSVDPVVANAGDPQGYNAYAYARNNPVRYADPTGKFFDECMLGGCRRYGYVDSVYGHEAANAEVVDPGYLAESGWQAGSVAANLGAFDGYPSLGDVFSALGDFVAALGDLVASGNGEGGPYPTDLVSIRTLADGTPEFTFVPEDVIGGRGVGVFVDRTLASSAAVAAFGEFSRVRGGQWLGQNGRWYSLQWGGNQYAGARSAVTLRAAQFRAAGRVVAAVQGARAVRDMVTGNTPLARTSGAFDAGLVAVGVWGGPTGLGVSVGMGVIGVGFEDIVGGVGHFSEIIINAGPNGPLR